MSPLQPKTSPKESLTVLIVEDDRSSRLIIETALKQGGHKIYDAYPTTKEEFVRIGRKQNQFFDVIVADIHLAKGDGEDTEKSGLEAVRTLRAHNVRTPIVLISANSEAEIEVKKDPDQYVNVFSFINKLHLHSQETNILLYITTEVEWAFSKYIGQQEASGRDQLMNSALLFIISEISKHGKGTPSPTDAQKIINHMSSAAPPPKPTFEEVAKRIITAEDTIQEMIRAYEAVLRVTR